MKSLLLSILFCSLIIALYGTSIEEDRFQQLLERITKLEGQQEEMKLLQEKVNQLEYLKNKVNRLQQLEERFDQMEHLSAKQDAEITELRHRQSGIQ